MLFNAQYPVDNVVDVIIHICFCVQRVASQPVILVSFEEQVSECHQILVFEGDHHFVAEAERDQLKKNRGNEQATDETAGFLFNLWFLKSNSEEMTLPGM